MSDRTKPKKIRKVEEDEKKPKESDKMKEKETKPKDSSKYTRVLSKSIYFKFNFIVLSCPVCL